MNIRTLPTRVTTWWYGIRHVQYYYEVAVNPPTISPSDNDTFNIQAAIDKAAEIPQWYQDIEAVYQAKWYRFFLQKPVLNSSANLSPGVYKVQKPIVMGDNVGLIGHGANATKIVKKNA